MAGQSSVIEFVGTAVRNRKSQRPSRSTDISTFVIPAVVYAPVPETRLVYALFAKEVRLPVQHQLLSAREAFCHGEARTQLVGW